MTRFKDKKDKTEIYSSMTNSTVAKGSRSIKNVWLLGTTFFAVELINLLYISSFYDIAKNSLGGGFENFLIIELIINSIMTFIVLVIIETAEKLAKERFKGTESPALPGRKGSQQIN